MRKDTKTAVSPEIDQFTGIQAKQHASAPVMVMLFIGLAASFFV